MTVILKNNASGFLATSISATDTSIILSTGTGANFPSLTAGQYFYATFSPTSGASEIVKCTARSGDTLTIIRAQEGTSALSFAGGSRVELRVTAQSVIDAIEDRVAGVDQASEITIADAGNYYTSGNVEGALQEAATFVQSGTSAVTRTRTAKLREARFSVKDFGAVGDGVADDTNAIKACIAAAGALVYAGNSGIFGAGVYTGTMPEVFFPSGVYKITSALSPDTGQALNYIWFKGDASILTLSPGVVCFGGLGFNHKIEGLTFRGGASAISIKTNNIDTTRIDIVNCEFNNQTDSCIRTDATSNSTLLVISRCKFTQYGSAVGAGAYVGKFLSGDQIVIENSWISNGSDCCFYNGALLQLKNVLGVPTENMNLAAGRWVDNYGAFSATDTRFGGEGGGAVIVRNYFNGLATGVVYPALTIGSVYLENCALFPRAIGADGGVILAYGGLPGSIVIRDCACPVDARLIRDKQAAGTLKSQIAAFAASSSTALFQVVITGVTWRSTLLTDDADLTTALLPYTQFMEYGSYPAKRVLYNFPDFKALTGTFTTSLATTSLIGTNYPQTSVPVAGTSAVDTGIFRNTAGLGWAEGAAYDVYVTGNTQSGGSSLYRAPQVGLLVIGTGYNVVLTIKDEIHYQVILAPNYQDIGEFTVTPVFWNGSTEATEFAVANTYQIRLKISGFPAGTEGAQLQVRLVKRL
jgi:hypothetical protein